MLKLGLAAASAVLALGLSAPSGPPLGPTPDVAEPIPAVVVDPTPVALPITGELLIGADQGARPQNNFLCRQCPWIYLVCRR